MANEPAFSAAERIAGHENLLIEILLRMPATSLLRFRVVSLSLCSIISSPLFHRHHSATSSPSPTGLYLCKAPNSSSSREISSVSLSGESTMLPPIPTNYGVWRSCNGYLLCHMADESSAKLVYNPLTKDVRHLPDATLDLEGINAVAFYLMHDPLKSPHFLAVCIISKLEGITHRLKIYSSETGEWGETSLFTAPPALRRFSGGVFWNGAIHWLSCDSVLYYLDVNLKEVVRKDMPSRHVKKVRCDFQEWGGYLHLIEAESSHSTEFDVLELDEDGSEWFVKYHADLTHVVSALSGTGDRGRLSILAVVREENDEDSRLILAISNKVVSYNFTLKTAELLHECPATWSSSNFWAFPYAASFASL